MDRSARKLLAGVGVAVLAAAVAGPVAAQSPAASGDAGAKYVIGFSNPAGIGNGWREEQLCSALAQAKVSGQVASVNAIHHEVDAAGQSEDIRNLIAAGVDAIVVNPKSGDGINDAIAEATAAKIPVVVVDQAVTEPSAYVISNDQKQYAYLGATWLFDYLQSQDKSKVVYMGGIKGASADTDRRAGWDQALAEHPGITEVQTVQTDWDQATGVKQINDIFASGEEIDGVWTSGIDNVIVTAFKDAGKEFVPIVGADGSEFVQQLVNEPGLVGALVTNPASVGGAGVKLALKILNGETVDKVTTFTPALFENGSEAGKAALAAAADPQIPATWPIGITIDGWTDYTKEDILACATSW